MTFFNALKTSRLLFKPQLFKSSVNQILSPPLPILVSNLSKGCFSLSRFKPDPLSSGVRLFNTKTSIDDDDDLICCFPECGCYCRRCQCQKLIPKGLRKGKGSAEGCGAECKKMDREIEVKRGRDKGKMWAAREDEKALYMKLQRPGIDQQHFSVTLKGEEEEGDIFIKGEAPNKLAGADKAYNIFSGTLHLSPSKYDLHSITYLVKNGVANIVFPKKISHVKYINID